MSTDTVLVTGASRGIGAAIAERLAGEYHVVNLDIAPPVKASAAEFVPVDLRDLAATRACLADVCARHRFTRLVNNVGMSSAVPLAELGDDLTEASIALNLRAALLCLQAVLPAMTEAGFGRVVNMGSRAALGKELRTVYSATKGGMHALTRTWALELADRGIAVNAVAPGMIDTELFRGANPPDSPITRKLVGAIPMKRLGTPDDVAKVVAFLLSDGAAYMTGQIVHICGGLSVGAVLE
jgi:NAD(P)-dependent dehydrogenase (short-subunit alcohol dehydrogenase family)